jgi:hypothetical protein
MKLSRYLKSYGVTILLIVITAVIAHSQPIQTGKSYVNLTKGISGGTIEPGDILEVRATIAMGNWNNPADVITNLRYCDTIPNFVDYVSNSMRLVTNEGLAFFPRNVSGFFTDAADADQAYINNVGRLRVNLGSTHNKTPWDVNPNVPNFVNMGSACNTQDPSAAGGGQLESDGRPSFGGGVVIVSVSYRIQVRSNRPLGSQITINGGAFYYNNASGTATRSGFAPNTIELSQNLGLCSSATGISAFSNETGGNFGSGNVQNRASSAVIPDYNYVAAISANQPNDGSYTIVNNLSANGSTNVNEPYHNNAAARVFTVFDITGDHTGASNPAAGNAPVAPGTNGGYFVVVNASYGTNRVINIPVSNLCGNTYYEFSAWFRNVCRYCGNDSTGDGTHTGTSPNIVPNPNYNGPDSSGVNPNLTFEIDGVDFYSTGNIAYSGQWVKKGFVYLTKNNQTSFTVTIRNNAPGGGGNDWAIDDVTLATCLPTLTMRPNNNPAYCLNASIDLSVAVSTYYNNYTHYQWERRVPSGVWVPAPEMPGNQTFTYSLAAGEYRDTVAIPTIIATAAMNGYQYRIRAATSLANLGTDGCSLYNGSDVITLNVQSSCNVLPAEVLSFNAQLKNSYAELKWTAKNEENLQVYEVQRSTDGRIFTTIGIVNAKNAGITGENYSFTDLTAVSTRFYYRLKLIGNSAGAVKYSNILQLSAMQVKQLEISNLVNPFASQINFQLNAAANETVELQLTDASGRVVAVTKQTVFRGTNAIVFDTPTHLQRGTYLLRAVSSSGTIYKTIQKQ